MRAMSIIVQCLAGISAVGTANGGGTRLLAVDADFADRLMEVDKATGAWAPIGSIGFEVIAMTYDQNTDTLYGFDNLNDLLITIDPTTGVGTAVGATGFTSLNGLAFDPVTRRLFASDTSLDVLVEINTVTGAGTTVGSFGSGDYTQLNGLTFDSSGTLFGADESSDLLAIIDPLTGLGSTVGPHGLEDPSGLAHDPESDTLFAVDRSPVIPGVLFPESSLFAIDKATGASTFIGELGVGNPSALVAVPIPNSGTLWMLAPLAVLVKRRRTSRNGKHEA